MLPRPAWRRLAAAGLVDVIPALTQPVLGICLGMQLLVCELRGGPDARVSGSSTPRCGASPRAPDRPVPQMGWNELEPDRRVAAPRRACPKGAYAYFVHSYAAPPGAYTRAATTYGVPFSAVIEQRNFFGTQFHPERSSRVGAEILGNFLNTAL